MKIHLVLLVETAIEAINDADYERKRDALIAEFKRKGYTITIEAEEEDDDEEGSDEDEPGEEE